MGLGVGVEGLYAGWPLAVLAVTTASGRRCTSRFCTLRPPGTSHGPPGETVAKGVFTFSPGFSGEVR